MPMADPTLPRSMGSPRDVAVIQAEDGYTVGAFNLDALFVAHNLLIDRKLHHATIQYFGWNQYGPFKKKLVPVRR